MARQKPTPAPEPATPDADFERGLTALYADVWWRWTVEHMRRAGDHDQGQADVAAACDLEPSGFGKFLNRERQITRVAWPKLKLGFWRLAKRYGFEYTDYREPDARSLAVAGCLCVLNKEGERRSVPRRPVGVLHFFCLLMMHASEGWILLKGGGAVPDKKRQALATETLDKAKLYRGKVTHLLEDYAVADRSYPLTASPAELVQLWTDWGRPWAAVYGYASAYLGDDR